GIWFLSRLINQKVVKYLCIIGCVLFYLSYLIEFISQYSIRSFFNTADTIGSEVMIVLCITYYFFLFKDDQYINLLREPSFWFVSGYFIFYTTSIGTDTFFKNLVNTTMIHSVSLRYIIMKFLNPILYGFWIVAMLCIKNKRK